VENDLPLAPLSELKKIIHLFRTAISSFKPLISIGTMMMPSVRSVFIQKKLYKDATQYFSQIDEDGAFKTFGITMDHYPLVKRNLDRLREFDQAAVVLPGAILLSLVATFDSFTSETIRIMLKHRPEILTGSSNTVTIKDLMKMGSFDDVTNKIIDDEVMRIMRRSHDMQIQYFEKSLCVEIREYYKGWGRFIEIFERRKLVAHGNLIVNKTHIENCKKHGYNVDNIQEGVTLPLDQRYLRRSVDAMLEFGLSLVFVIWLKHFKENSDDAYKILSMIAYELIRDGEPHVSAKLLELALQKQNAAAPDVTIKMMIINLVTT
jgi:hypothetical protein